MRNLLTSGIVHHHEQTSERLRLEKGKRDVCQVNGRKDELPAPSNKLYTTAERVGTVWRDRLTSKKDKHTHTNASKRERKNSVFHKATSAAEALECTGARIIDIVYTGSSPEAKGREKTRVGQAWSGSEKVAKPLRVRNKERKAKQARQHEQQSHARRCIRAVVSDAGAPSPR